MQQNLKRKMTVRKTHKVGDKILVVEIQTKEDKKKVMKNQTKL